MTSDQPQMTGDHFIIRRASLDDVEIIADFNAALASESEALKLDRRRLLEGVRSLLNVPQKGFYVLAETDRGVMGQTMVTFEWSDWRNGVFWWIQSVYIRPEARRQGVFARLYRHLEADALSLGNVCGPRLYVEAHNDVALRTYQQLGMSRTVYQMYERDFVIKR